MTAQEQLREQYRVQIEALQRENKRLNNELAQVKHIAFKIRLSDPNFDKPISEIETDFEIVKPNKYD